MASKRPPPSNKPLSKKLQVKPGVTVLTVNLPREVTPLLEGLSRTTKATGTVDAALLFVRDAQQLDEAMGGVGERWSEDPLVWVCYPKGGSGVETDLNRDRLWELLAPHGMRPVAQVAVDDVWSALRFRRTGGAHV